MLLSMSDDVEMARFLFDAGAEVWIRTELGLGPLDAMELAGEERMARFLRAEAGS